MSFNLLQNIWIKFKIAAHEAILNTKNCFFSFFWKIIFVFMKKLVPELCFDHAASDAKIFQTKVILLK